MIVFIMYVQDLNFRHYPDNVNHVGLVAVIVVTASNNISSFSVCIYIEFDSMLSIIMCLYVCQFMLKAHTVLFFPRH